MRKIIITKGLPASGKTTWARTYKPETFKRINKDDLRAMLDNSKWSKSNERFVLQVRDSLILSALQSGYGVIVDDTNLAPKHEARIREVVSEWSKTSGIPVEVQVQVFEVSVEECIARDLKRPASVGERVIRQMYNQFLRPTVVPTMQDASLSPAVLCDIDGTVALMNGRGPFEWLRVNEDLPNRPVIALLQAIRRDGMEVIFFSGRDGCCEEATRAWLRVNLWENPKLFMRAAGDQRKDSVVKREMFEQHVRDKYFVWFVLDDRNQVVELWRRELGLPCFQVAYGDF